MKKENIRFGRSEMRRERPKEMASRMKKRRKKTRRRRRRRGGGGRRRSEKGTRRTQ